MLSQARFVLRIVVYFVWCQVLLLIPTVLVVAPLWFFVWLVRLLLAPLRVLQKHRNTVMVGGGSTAEALHISRVLHAAGLRVVSFDIKGHFPLAHYSRVVDKYYNVPDPCGYFQDYIRTLCYIAGREKARYFVPVSEPNARYYDALAKPKLESQGCRAFCPGVEEFWVLDNLLDFLQKLSDTEISTPGPYNGTKRRDVLRLYDRGLLKEDCSRFSSPKRNGLNGFALPVSSWEFPCSSNGCNISRIQQIAVHQKIDGDFFETCTTVRNNKVIANVTCMISRTDEQTEIDKLEHKNVEKIREWVKTFFSNLQHTVSGHFTLQFVICKNSKKLYPLRCSNSVGPAVLCHNTARTKLMGQHCQHFNGTPVEPFPENSKIYWFHKEVLKTVMTPQWENLVAFVNTVMYNREAIFNRWDPLPYMAFYHIKIPLLVYRSLVQGRVWTRINFIKARLECDKPPRNTRRYGCYTS